MQAHTRDSLLAWVERHAAELDQQAAGNPMASSAWWRCYLSEVQAPGQPLAVLGSAAGGWLLLQAQGRAWRQLGNYYCTRSSPWQQGLFDGTQLHLLPLDPPDADRLAAQARQQGWWAQAHPAFVNWQLAVQGRGFADYMAGRPSQLRATWQRKQRKFERAGGRLQLLDAQASAAELRTGLDAYERIYAQSWKGSDSPESHPRFVRAFAEAAAAAGWLRLGLAWLNGEAVAAQLWFTAAGSATVFKLAYDERHAEWSAGTLLTAALLQQALEQDRVHTVDYGSGDERYKADWMDVRGQRLGLHLSNPRTLTGLALGVKESLARLRRNWRA